jgi:hypothetical protein
MICLDNILVIDFPPFLSKSKQRKSAFIQHVYKEYVCAPACYICQPVKQIRVWLPILRRAEVYKQWVCKPTHYMPNDLNNFSEAEICQKKHSVLRSKMC